MRYSPPASLRVRALIYLIPDNELVAINFAVLYATKNGKVDQNARNLLTETYGSALAADIEADISLVNVRVLPRYHSMWRLFR